MNDSFDSSRYIICENMVLLFKNEILIIFRLDTKKMEAFNHMPVPPRVTFEFAKIKACLGLGLFELHGCDGSSTFFATLPVLLIADTPNPSQLPLGSHVVVRCYTVNRQKYAEITRVLDSDTIAAFKIFGNWPFCFN